MFTVIEGAYAIIVSRGVYRQVKVYERKGQIFVAHGSGFIYVSSMYGKTRYGTSIPNVWVDELAVPFTHGKNSLGYLINPANYEDKK